MGEDRIPSRVATRAFEAWDPAFGTVIIVNAGATLRVRRIAFGISRGDSLPPIERSVEFECNEALCYAEFDRFEENTSAGIQAEAETR